MHDQSSTLLDPSPRPVLSFEAVVSHQYGLPDALASSLCNRLANHLVSHSIFPHARAALLALSGAGGSGLAYEASRYGASRGSDVECIATACLAAFASQPHLIENLKLSVS